MLGTPQYMAPEQIRGEAIDGRTDVYALGCMIYEMVTARLPFEAPTVMAMLSKHLLETPCRRRSAGPISRCRRRSISSCSRAMAKDPARAPGDDGAVRRAARGAARDAAARSESQRGDCRRRNVQPSSRPPRRRRTRRRRWTPPPPPTPRAISDADAAAVAAAVSPPPMSRRRRPLRARRAAAAASAPRRRIGRSSVRTAEAPSANADATKQPTDAGLPIALGRRARSVERAPAMPLRDADDAKRRRSADREAERATARVRRHALRRRAEHRRLRRRSDASIEHAATSEPSRRYMVRDADASTQQRRRVHATVTACGSASMIAHVEPRRRGHSARRLTTQRRPPSADDRSSHRAIVRISGRPGARCVEADRSQRSWRYRERPLLLLRGMTPEAKAAIRLTQFARGGG